MTSVRFTNDAHAVLLRCARRVDEERAEDHPSGARAVVPGFRIFSAMKSAVPPNTATGWRKGKAGMARQFRRRRGSLVTIIQAAQQHEEDQGSFVPASMVEPGWCRAAERSNLSSAGADLVGNRP